jgi:DcuC family C4-dicarboxylate transporter
MQMAMVGAILAGAVYLLVRKVDVRLVLFSAGLALATVALRPLAVFDQFAKGMGDGRFIAPICSAFAFASVLRVLGADQEMVRLLIRPVRRVKGLLVPGGCLVGFLANSAITSQTGAAAAVGPILVPLMMAAGFSPAVAGATLLLGCSGGGNLLNPGEPDLVGIQTGAQVPIESVQRAIAAPILLGFGAAVVTFTALNRSLPAPPLPATEASPAPAPEPPIDWIKALLPPLPIVMLLALEPRFHLVPALEAWYPQGLPVAHAMLFSTLVAMVVGRRDFSGKTRTFFEGMGSAYANIISLIITGGCFIEGLRATGLIHSLVGAVRGSGFWGQAASGFFPWLVAVLCGSGVAPSIGFAQSVLPMVREQDPAGAVNLGVLAAIGSTFGRTMSPVSAVVIFSSTLVKRPPLEVIARVAGALAVGAGVVLWVVARR